MKKQYIIFLCAVSLCLSACKSTKKAEITLSNKESGIQVISSTGALTQVTGILTQGTNGAFSMTTGSGKSIVSWLFVSSGDAPAVYNQLKDYVGKKVRISGTIKEQRSLWNITVAVTDILKADD